jgi:monoamine oxidase
MRDDPLARRAGARETRGVRLEAVVIGAGAAGLAAAARLKREGLRVAVLEARDRVGGRIETCRHTAFPCPVELGAEFVHGTAPSFRKWARAVRLDVRKPLDVRWIRFGEALERADEAFEQVSELLVQSGSSDVPFASFLENPRTQARWSDQVRALAAMFVEGYYAAPVGRAGTAALSFMEEKAAEVDAQILRRVMDGYDALTSRMAARLDRAGGELWLNAVVHALQWSGSGVEVHARTRTGIGLPTFEADAAVVTLPLAVLAASPPAEGAVTFAPGLPGKMDAIRRLDTGPIVKIAIRFRRSFWDEQLHPFTFAHGPGLDVPTWWTPLPHRVPVLIGWTGGPPAEALSNVDPSIVVRHALRSLAELFGRPEREIERLVEAFRVRDWRADPFARGGYAVLPVGGLDAQRELARPVGDRIFFAGEATHTGGFAGTVHGALETGERAAEELLTLRKGARRRRPRPGGRGPRATDREARR